MCTAPDEIQGQCYLMRYKCWVELVYFGDFDAGRAAGNSRFGKKLADGMQSQLLFGYSAFVLSTECYYPAVTNTVSLDAFFVCVWFSKRASVHYFLK